MFNFLKQKTTGYIERLGLSGGWSVWNNSQKYALEGYEKNPVVRAVVDKRVQALAALPFVVTNNGKELDESDDLFRLLNISPNEWQTADEFNSCVYRARDIAGKSPIEIVAGTISSRGKPIELNCMPYSTEPILNASKTRIEAFKVNGTQTVKQEDVLYWYIPSPLNIFQALSPMKSAALAIDQHNHSNEWNYKMLKNEYRPPGMLIGKMRDDIAQNYREDLKKKEPGEMLVVPEELKWTPTGLGAKDMDWLSGQDNAASLICAVFGTSKMLIGVGNDPTFANYQQAREAFDTNTIIPIAKSYDNQINKFLAPKFGPGYKVTRDYKNMPSMKRAMAEMMQLFNGVLYISQNEKRTLVGFEERDNADLIFEPAGAVPVGTDAFSFTTESGEKAIDMMAQHYESEGMSFERAQEKAFAVLNNVAL